MSLANAVLLSAALAVTFCCYGAVDLWLQTVLHLFLWLCFLASVFARPRRLEEWASPTLIAWLLFLAALGCLTICSGDFARSRIEFFMWLSCFLFFYSVRSLDSRDKKIFLIGTLAACVALALWAVLQACEGKAATAGFLNPNNLAGLLLLAIGPAFDLEIKPRWIPIGAVCVLAAALWATRSTGAWMSAALAAVYVAWRSQDSRRHWVYGLVAVLAVAAAAHVWLHPDPDRLFWWKSCIAMIRSHPLIGLGPGTFDAAIPHLAGEHLFSLYAHNTWLQWFVELGAIGFLVLLGLLARAVRSVKNLAVQASLIAACAHNFVDYSLMIPANLFFAWAILASYADDNSMRTRPARRWEIPGFAFACAIMFAGVAASAALVRVFAADRLYARSAADPADRERVDLESNAFASYRTDLDNVGGLALLARKPGEPPDQAIAYLSIARRHRPLDPELTLELYRLLELTRRNDEASSMLSEFLQRYPFYRNDRRFQAIVS